jgi:MFS superfamily sulfate permease-like transporter
MATVVAATVSPISGGDPDQAATLAALLALLTAAVFFGAGLARLGWVAQFISRPVMAGFVFGMAFVIAVGQVPKLLGVPAGEGDMFQAAWTWRNWATRTCGV